MNKLTIIGNLTRDPESHPAGDTSVCSFTVAVNRRSRSNAANGQPEADYFRVSAWRQLGENCQKYLAKGRKVCVVGPVTARTYTANDGTTRVSLEVTAEDVEFLSSRNEAGAPASYSAPAAPVAPTAQNSGYAQVETEELPF
jgi:single-strand DNA-binding protein